MRVFARMLALSCLLQASLYGAIAHAATASCSVDCQAGGTADCQNGSSSSTCYAVCDDLSGCNSQCTLGGQQQENCSA
jgi:hypothetical protein